MNYIFFLYNKVNKIMIQLNNKISTSALSIQSSKNLLYIINHYLQAKNINIILIYITKKLKTSNITIYIVNLIKIKS